MPMKHRFTHCILIRLFPWERKGGDFWWEHEQGCVHTWWNRKPGTASLDPEPCEIHTEMPSCLLHDRHRCLNWGWPWGRKGGAPGQQRSGKIPNLTGDPEMQVGKRKHHYPPSNWQTMLPLTLTSTGKGGRLARGTPSNMVERGVIDRPILEVF